MQNELYVFEIRSFLLSRSRVVKILRSIPGINIRRTPRFLSRFREQEFCEFELGGQVFKVWELFSDKSHARSLRVRIVVGTKQSAGSREQMNLVRDAFVRNR
jgi:hypothetical protein